MPECRANAGDIIIERMFVWARSFASQNTTEYIPGRGKPGLVKTANAFRPPRQMPTDTTLIGAMVLVSRPAAFPICRFSGGSRTPRHAKVRRPCCDCRHRTFWGWPFSSPGMGHARDVPATSGSSNQLPVDRPILPAEEGCLATISSSDGVLWLVWNNHPRQSGDDADLAKMSRQRCKVCLWSPKCPHGTLR
jgi:hypothetical protein